MLRLVTFPINTTLLEKVYVYLFQMKGEVVRCKMFYDALKTRQN